MAGYRPLLSQTQLTSGSVSPSSMPVAHLQHLSNRNIGSIYHHSLGMGMNNTPGLVYPPATHSLHGTPSISMQQHHHHQQHRHSMVLHQQHQQQQFQQHHQLLGRHRHLVGNSTRHNNLLHHHGNASGTNGGNINMTTTIMPLNASK